VLGDGQPVVTALIVPDFAALGRALGIPSAEPTEVIAHPEAHKRIREEVDSVCTSVADFERVRGFVLLPQRFTVEGGELTPTLKLRRKVIREKYAHIIQSLRAN